MKICSVKQIFYSNGREYVEGVEKNQCTCCFALELTDGEEKGYLDVMIDKNLEIGDNLLKTSNMVEFFKTLYVNEIELNNIMTVYIKGTNCKFELYFEM